MRRNRRSSFVLLLIGSLLGAISFSWPLYIPESNFFIFQPDSARAFAILIALVGIGVVSLDISQGALDSKAVALLGVLAALIAALRLVGAGAIGIEPMWFLLIISGYVFGANFGFALGVISMGVSALMTGGIGPWLPFQMLAAGWIGLFAGSVARLTRRFKLKVEILSLVLVGLFSSLTFGFLMDLQLWPWITSSDTQLSFISGGAFLENFQRFMVFHLATALAWDIPRAITTSVLIALTAKPLLHSLRRAQSRLNFTLRAMQPTVSAR
jgi:energy-coupling factor transport system substrate-specific component